MITIGYSTRQIDKEFLEYLRSSCGVKDVEVIPVENNGDYSLTQVYNKIIDESTNDIVVLCHDDIYFDTKNWGKRIISHFNKSDYGILGVAGSTEMAETGVWWEDKKKMLGIVNHQSEGKKWMSNYSQDLKNEITEVCVLDGVFLSIHKERIKNNFNETIEGFHFYDVDFTFNNHISGCKVGVIYNVRLTHLSIGMTNDEWEKNKNLFLSNNSELIPYKITPEISYHKTVTLINNPYKVAVIIPTKNNNQILFDCIQSILEKTNYSNLEIFIADTGSNKDILDEIENEIQDFNFIHLIKYNYYNFAKINNDVVFNHTTEKHDLLLFCNNDIKLINDCITNMVTAYKNNKNTVGTIGARLYYEDKTIQHSGMQFIIKNGAITIDHYGVGTHYTYHRGIKPVGGNTAALMMINRNLFKSIGGFNENYIECFEDVELNIECINRGKKNLFVSNAVSYHYESKTRKVLKERTERELKDYNERLLPKILNSMTKLKTHFYM